jgi:hypothetical protein
MRFVPFALCFSTLLCSVCLSLIASPSGREYFVKTTADFVVFPRVVLPVTIQLYKLQVIKDNIIRGLAPVTKYTGSLNFYLEVQESKDQFVLKTSRLVANVRFPTRVGMGVVLFSDNTGKTFLQKPIPRPSKWRLVIKMVVE